MKISITLPNFNHARFLPQMIESILSQTYRDWELVIVDDGSTDDSWTVIEKYRARDNRIIAERLPENKGVNIALRRSLSRCTGDLIYAASSDDYFVNSKYFELAISYLQRFPRAAGVFGSSQVVEIEGKPLWIMGTYSNASGFIAPEVAVRDFLAAKLFIPGISATWKRALVDSLGGYNESLGPQSDYYVNHALAMLHGVVYLNEIVSVTRRVEGSYSQAADNEQFFRRHAMVEKQFRSHGDLLLLPDKGVRRWRWKVINGRLSYKRQMRLVALHDETFAGLQEWERAGLLPEFLESGEFLKYRCQRIRQQLEAAKASAEKAFDDIAKPLDPWPSPRSWLRSGLRRIAGAVMRRVARFAREG